MSEPVTRQRPSVDLDDFERRLRQSTAADHDEDPLAELARLVGEQHDPYQDVFAREAAVHSAQSEMAPRFSGGFAAIEAGLKGDPMPPAEAHYSDEPPYDQDGYAHMHDQYAGYDEQGYPIQSDPAGYAPAAKSRRPVYLMAATIIVGVLGVGAAFALKGHSTTPSDVKTIMADAGPTKIQPPADSSGDQGGQDASNQTMPTKTVSNTEEPVDVSQAVTGNTSQTDAASVPVPPSPGQADGTDFASGMPAPKKVKVVSVRPDGSIVSGDGSSAAAPSPALAPTQSPVTAAIPLDPAAALSPESTSPSPDDQPASAIKTSKPKSVSRVVPKHMVAAAQDNAADGQPVKLTPKPAHKVKPKPVKVAEADPADTSPTDQRAAKPVSGSFAVQLAAPASEAEARSASSKFAKKYAGDLDGHALAIHKADSNGKSVFRVRTGGLSREEATSLCDKLKADGGACFVARN